MYQQQPQYPVKPSGATAIIASVLSLIGAVWFFSGVVESGIDLVKGSWPEAPIGFVLNVAGTGVFLIGAILLLRRKPLGRILVVAGAGFTVGVLVLNSLISGFLGSFLGGFGGYARHSRITEEGLLSLPFLGVLLLAAATAALALVKPTVVWMATPKPVRMPPPGYYPPPPQQQQYPPPPQQYPPRQYPGQRPPGY